MPREPGQAPIPELPFTPLEQVEVRGSGAIPLVLIADYGMDWRLWESFLERNKTRYRMFAVTLPGIAGTTAPAALPADAFYSDGLWTRNVERGILQLLDEHKVDRAFVMGHSFGGHVAIRMAILHPDRIAGAISLDGTVTVELPKQQDPRLPRAQREAFVAATKRAGDKVPDDKFFQRQKEGLAKTVEDPERSAFIASMIDGAPKSVFLHYLSEYYAADLWPLLVDLRSPIAVFVPVAPSSQANQVPAKAVKAKWTRWFQAAKKNCEVIWFENCLPILTESAPYELDRAVHAFVHGNFVPGKSAFSKRLSEYVAPEEGGPPETPRVTTPPPADSPATDDQK